MTIVYMYNINNLNEVIEQYALSFEDYKSRINLYYPPYDANINIPSEIRFNNPIYDNGVLREKNKEELYTEGLYTLEYDEIIQDGKIKKVELSQYEYIEDNKVKFDREKKIKDIETELYNLRLEKEVAPFEFEVDGEIYLQQNRTIDQSNITKVLFQMVLMFLYDLMLNAIKGKMPTIQEIFEKAQKLSYKNWKFYTKDGSEKFEAVTVMKFMEMSKKMNLQTTISMVTETELKHKLITLSDTELKSFNASEEYVRRFNEEMIEATKKITE